MRSLLAISVIAAALLAAPAAHAEKRIFIIANSPDNYGVDRCLAGGQACGAAAAAAYCQSKQFTAASSYRKVDRDDITGAVPTGDATCGRSGCDEFVAIECTR
jgi:ABC-type sugar transport system substrate-binding protein